MSTVISHPLKPAPTFEQQIERLKTVHNLTIMHEEIPFKAKQGISGFSCHKTHVARQ